MRIFDNFGLHDYHSDVPQFWMGHIQSRDTFRPNAHKRKYLINDMNNLMMTLFLYEYLKLYTINIKQETGLVRMKVVKITVFFMNQALEFIFSRILTFHFSFQVGQLFRKFRLHLRHRKRTVVEKE